jgi:hypothetical protein
MDIFQSIVASRLIFVLGIINLVAGILIVLSCRCMTGARVTGKLMKYTAYQRFFRYHCYIWWIFWASVVIHAIFAIGLLGNPF